MREMAVGFWQFRCSMFFSVFLYFRPSQAHWVITGLVFPDIWKCEVRAELHITVCQITKFCTLHHLNKLQLQVAVFFIHFSTHLQSTSLCPLALDGTKSNARLFLQLALSIFLALRGPCSRLTNVRHPIFSTVNPSCAKTLDSGQAVDQQPWKELHCPLNKWQSCCENLVLGSEVADIVEALATNVYASMVSMVWPHKCCFPIKRFGNDQTCGMGSSAN